MNSTPFYRERSTGLDGGTWTLEGYDPNKNNCGKANFHVDYCRYGEENHLGEICNMIRTYAKEERLHLIKP